MFRVPRALLFKSRCSLLVRTKRSILKPVDHPGAASEGRPHMAPEMLLEY